MVEGSDVPLWLVITVVSIALVVGVSMIAVVLGKYALHQWFHILGGPTLSSLGVVLIGLSVFGNVKLKAGEFEAELQRLHAHVETLESSVASKEQQTAELSNQLEKRQGVVRRLEDELKIAVADLASLRANEQSNTVSQADWENLSMFIVELKQEVSAQQQTINTLVKSANEIGVYAATGKQALAQASKYSFIGQGEPEGMKLVNAGVQSFQQIVAEVERINSLPMR